jgi:hypothetical protein
VLSVRLSHMVDEPPPRADCEHVKGLVDKRHSLEVGRVKAKAQGD